MDGDEMKCRMRCGDYTTRRVEDAVSAEAKATGEMGLRSKSVSFLTRAIAADSDDAGGEGGSVAGSTYIPT